MASGKSVTLRAVQPAGPVQVAGDDLPAGQHQPGPGPYRAEMRARGHRSDAKQARLLRARRGMLRTQETEDRLSRRVARRTASMGDVVVRQRGFGAKHARAERAQKAAQQ